MSLLEEQLYGKRVIDNRSVTLTEAVKHFLLEPEIHCFNMAVGYFYLSGLQLIKKEFIHFMNEKNGRVNILMGNETNQKTSELLSLGSNPENYLEYMPKMVESDASEIDDKDFLKLLHQWLVEKRIEVKVYTGEANYFHAKSYLFYDKLDARSGKAIVGSSNFSKNGLQGNTELNVLSADNFYALKDWFDSIWYSEEVTAFSPELLNLIKKNVPEMENGQLYKPVRETYYDFANIYARPYAELDTSIEWVKELYPHQQSGVIDIEDKLNTFGTAVLADGVGLGKTRTTAGIIRLAFDAKRNVKTLIIADKKLRTQWSEELAIVGITNDKYNYITREKFALLSREKLNIIAENYSLIIIDEAHLGFKNRGTNVYRKIQYVDEQAAANGKKIRGLLLTATPWNNSRKDVLNLGSLFLNVEDIPNDRTYKQYFLFGNNGRVINKLETDDVAFNEFWEDLFLQRTRKTYGGEKVDFAQRKFPTITIPYEPRKNQIFSDNFDRISDLRFPYMDPIRYIVEERNQVGSDRLKMMLLKRADSSWIAYLNSLVKIEENTHLLLKELEKVENSVNLRADFKAYLGRKYDLLNYESNQLGLFNIDDPMELGDNTFKFSLESKVKKHRYFDKITKQIEDIKTSKAKSSVKKMISDANADLAILDSLINEIRHAYEKRDEKFEKVREVILQELSSGRKVILISQFKDTAKYYYEILLEDNLISDNNIGLVTGSEKDNRIGHQNETKKEILDRFSPKSKNREDIWGTTKEIHLLVGTDTISTGQNLQDAVVMMNLDLPYNPMILEQRIGRIDRPRSGQGANEIFIYTFPVYDAIEAELKMTERLGKKMEGVLSDTQFDDIVLPEYLTYLETVKQQSGKAVEKMLDNTLMKTIYQDGFASEKHSASYKEANKRMYNIRVEDFQKSKNILYRNVSFSKGAEGHSIVVMKVIYHDVNGSEISSENIIVDLDDIENRDITNAENHLYDEIRYGLYSTADYSEAKAEMLIKEMKVILDRVKLKAVNDYNSELGIIGENMASLQDKTSQKAAAAIKASVRDRANREMIRSKIREASMDPKVIGTLAKNIEMVDPESELYEIVQEIAVDVNQFWINFVEYVELFDITNINTLKGAAVKKIGTRKANVSETTYEILLANLVTE